MMKKSKSKPMTQILERLCRFEYITVVIFPEDVILNEPVDKWPLCDCLISFHSKGTVPSPTETHAKTQQTHCVSCFPALSHIDDVCVTAVFTIL